MDAVPSFNRSRSRSGSVGGSFIDRVASFPTHGPHAPNAVAERRMTKLAEEITRAWDADDEIPYSQDSSLLRSVNRDLVREVCGKRRARARNPPPLRKTVCTRILFPRARRTRKRSFSSSPRVNLLPPFRCSDSGFHSNCGLVPMRCSFVSAEGREGAPDGLGHGWRRRLARGRRVQLQSGAGRPAQLSQGAQASRVFGASRC